MKLALQITTLALASASVSAYAHDLRGQAMVFSSIIALLSISPAAANSVADVFYHPRVAPLVAAYHKQDPATADIPCVSEIETFFECIGEACIDCIVDVMIDLGENPTCKSIEKSDFCDDMAACAVGHCAGKEESCEAAGDAVVTCAEENYPSSEDTSSDDIECPGLCGVEEVLDVADEESNNVVDVFSHEKVAPIVASYYGEDSAEDIPCEDELDAVVECLGMGCITCVVDVILDVGESPTCESLKKGPFCTDLMKCAEGLCAGKVCTDEADNLVVCAEANDGDGTSEDDMECPGLCEGKKEFLSIA